MRTIVAVSIPIVSHYYPVLRLADELRKRGHRVIYISSQWSLQAVNLDCPLIQTMGIDDNLKELLLGNNANLLRASREFNAKWENSLREILLKLLPQLMITDMTTTVAVELARQLNIPLVSNLPGGVRALGLLGVPTFQGSLTIGGWTLLPLRLRSVLIGMVLPKLARSIKHAVTGIVLMNSFVGLDEATAIPPNFFYTGHLSKPSTKVLDKDLQSWLEVQQSENRPIIYVTFGSMVDLSLEFITAIYLGLKRSGMAVLWSIKRGCLPENNPNMYVRPWLPQAQLLALPAVRAVITHCGWNGVLDCIEAQKPMLMVPQFNDQPGNCERLLELGTGVRLYKKWATLFLFRGLEIKKVRFAPEHLAECIREVIENPRYLMAVKRLHKLSTKSLGLQRSCDLIESVIEDGYEHLQDKNCIKIQESSGIGGLLLALLVIAALFYRLIIS